MTACPFATGKEKLNLSISSILSFSSCSRHVIDHCLSGIQLGLSKSFPLLQVGCHFTGILPTLLTQILTLFLLNHSMTGWSGSSHISPFWDLFLDPVHTYPDIFESATFFSGYGYRPHASGEFASKSGNF